MVLVAVHGAAVPSATCSRAAAARIVTASPERLTRAGPMRTHVPWRRRATRAPVPCRQARPAANMTQIRRPALASARATGALNVSRAVMSSPACRTMAAASAGGGGAWAVVASTAAVSTFRPVRRTVAVIAATLLMAQPAAAAPSLLHVGDSLAVGSDPPLRALLPGWSIKTDALTSRPTALGVAIIDRQPSLPANLVVELGTNDSPDQAATFASYVRRVLALAGSRRCVVWVNIHRPPYHGISYAGFNRVLDDIAASSPNLAVVDWNGMVGSGQAQVAPDGVHATPAGYRARAAAIAQALEGCSSQHPAGGAGNGSHTLKPNRSIHTTAPKPRPAAKPKPAAPKPKAIKVYTPTTTTATPARVTATPAA